MRPKSRKDGNKTRGKNFKIQKISSYRKVKVVWTQKTMSSGSRTWKTGVKGSREKTKATILYHYGLGRWKKRCVIC